MVVFVTQCFLRTARGFTVIERVNTDLVNDLIYGGLRPWYVFGALITLRIITENRVSVVLNPSA